MPLLDDIVQGHCIPVIGAGFSKNAELPAGVSMPLWTDLGKHFASLNNNYPFSTPTDAISAFAQKFSRIKLVEELGKVLHIDDAKPGAAHISFAKLDFRIVLTTNFDFLIEEAYEATGKTHWAILNEDQLSVSKPETTTIVLKIHGDLKNPDRVIITEEDYDYFLDEHPLLATYVTNLLITKTPLFLGYSVGDPDFRRLRSIIKNRLGKLRRPAYTILVNPTEIETARYNRRDVKVISLPGDKSKYSSILDSLFKEIEQFWNKETAEKSVVISDETRAQALMLPRDSETNLCFFAIPTTLHTYYREHVFPIVERLGFTPITASEVISPGDNILAKISTLIDRSVIVVVDASSSAAFAELGLAAGKGKEGLIIFEEGSELPTDIRGFKSIRRPRAPEIPDQEFIANLSAFFGELSEKEESKLYYEPLRLLDKREYRAAVITAFILLEVELKDKLRTRARERLLQEDGLDLSRFSLRRMLELARKHGIVSSNDYRSLREFVAVRNRLVHTKEKIHGRRARSIVEKIMEILDRMRAHERENS